MVLPVRTLSSTAQEHLDDHNNEIRPNLIALATGVVMRLIWTGSAYPAKAGPAGAFYEFVGPNDPNALGLMADGDSWVATA